MDISCVTQHIVQPLADMLAILDRGVTSGVNVEIVAELARRRVDEHSVAAAALHKAGAALVEEVTLGVGAADRTTNEVGVGARARDRLGGIELEPANDLVSGLNRHQQLAGDERHPREAGQQSEANAALGVQHRGGGYPLDAGCHRTLHAGVINRPR